MSTLKTLTLTETERAYMRLLRLHGQAAPAAKRLDIQPPVADDGETDCWTHAWQVARRTGARYMEGVCRRPGAGGPSMHAWVEEDSPLGARVVECTEGYEDATDYAGVQVDNTPGGKIDMLTDDWMPRSSVLQASLAAGLSVQRTYDLTRPPRRRVDA